MFAYRKQPERKSKQVKLSCQTPCTRPWSFCILCDILEYNCTYLGWLLSTSQKIQSDSAFVKVSLLRGLPNETQRDERLFDGMSFVWTVWKLYIKATRVTEVIFKEYRTVSWIFRLGNHLIRQLESKPNRLYHLRFLSPRKNKFLYCN